MKQFTFDNRWDEIKGKLKQRYGQLTDDDLTFAEGKGEEMLARLREKLSVSAKDLRATLDELQEEGEGLLDKAKAKVGEWTHDLRDRADKVASGVKEKASVAAEQVKVQASAAYGQARERAITVYDDGTEYVRQNPRKSLMFALFAGFVAGLAVRR